MSLRFGETVLHKDAAPHVDEAAIAQPRDSPTNLPPQPPVTITPNRKWAPLDLRELWIHRELLYFLAWRDLKVRYKQTVVGMAWAVLQPLLTTLVLTIFLGRLARVRSDGLPYAVFAYAGLLPWTFFANAVMQSGRSLVVSAHLITKVYFPRAIIPIATIMAGLVDFAIAFVVLAGLMTYYGIRLTGSIVLLPLLVALITLLALSAGLWVSALNVQYRDVSAALPLVIQLLMFASPVMYPSSLVPHGWQAVYALNPLAGIIEAFRSSLFGRGFNWQSLAISTTITLIFVVSSAYGFRRLERSFADVV